MSKAFSLDSTYVNLRPDDSATTLKVDARFWRSVHKRRDLNSGRLVGVTPQKVDWPIWERHPNGEEILIMLSGEMDIVMETRSGNRRRRLKAGQSLVVPRGVWHRGLARKPGKLMFITPGAGTEHRPVTL
jgi:mannose-6-phosphate isomerase-like protein (cupin superfamily)